MVELAIHTRNNRRSSQLSSVLQVIWILCTRTNCFQLLAVRDLIHIASHPALPCTAQKTIYQKKKNAWLGNISARSMHGNRMKGWDSLRGIFFLADVDGIFFFYPDVQGVFGLVLSTALETKEQRRESPGN